MGYHFIQGPINVEMCNWVYESWATHKKLFDKNDNAERNIGKCVSWTDFLGHRIGLIEVSKEDRTMTDNIEKKVAVDGPVANEGEHGSSPFSPGQVSPADPLGFGQRWTVARKREVVLRLLRGEPMELMSRQFGVEIFRLEQWREKAIAGIEAALKDRKGDPVKAELDTAMKRIGELTMQVELLEAKRETSGPLGRRRSRR